MGNNGAGVAVKYAGWDSGGICGRASMTDIEAVARNWGEGTGKKGDSGAIPGFH